MEAQNAYNQIAKESRLKVLDMVYNAQTSHIGSNFSCADIMAVLFEKIDLEKDKFILSAGWKAAILYYHLWRKGRITEAELMSYCQEGSKFIGLAEPIIPEIPFAGGSMGFGFPAAVGYALSKKLKGEDGKVYCLMSDGELAIGTTWEAALIAKQHNLTNLIVLVDRNGFQAMGKTEDILQASMPLDGLVVDGHNFQEIEDALSLKYLKMPGVNQTPFAITFNTIKGKGVSFMEDKNLYHYKAPTQDEYQRAKQELTI